MDGVRHLVVMVRMRASAVVPRWCSVWQVQVCHGIVYNRRLLLQFIIAIYNTTSDEFNLLYQYNLKILLTASKEPLYFTITTFGRNY